MVQIGISLPLFLNHSRMQPATELESFMEILMLVSLLIGVAGGFVYTQAARQSYKAFFLDGVRHSARARFLFLAFRVGISFCSMALLIMTGIAAPVALCVGFLLGYIISSIWAVVGKWI